MNTGTALVTHVEPAKPMEPRQSAFNDPARSAEATPVGRSAFRKLRPDTAPVQDIAVRLGIVPAVSLDERGFAPRPAGPAAQRWDAVDQRQQLGNVVPVGAGEHGGQRDAARFGENVMFRPRLTAIGWVRSSFFPPRSARTEALSTRARAKSSWPRWRNSASSTAWRRRQTPARCQRTRRRQHVLPDPHPISFGNICHGSPLRNTNTIPVNAARSGTRGRPMFFHRRRGGFGNSGSIRAHKASSIKRWDMRDRLAVGHATVPIQPGEYKRHVSYF